MVTFPSLRWWDPIEADEDDSEVLGGSIGGLHQGDIPRVVGNLLDELARAVEIQIRPEPMPNNHHYIVEWRYLEYDYGVMGWKPVRERLGDEV